MPEQRINDHLDTFDAAADYWPEFNDYAPSFDEWNALRLSAGRPVGAFEDYLHEINATPAGPAMTTGISGQQAA